MTHSPREHVGGGQGAVFKMPAWGRESGLAGEEGFPFKST